MLEALKKKLGIVSAAPAAEATAEEGVGLVVEASQGEGLGTPTMEGTPSMADLTLAIEANDKLQATVADLTAQLSTVTEQLTAAASQVAELQAQVNEFVKAQAEAAATALQAKLQARKEKVVGLVGDARADALLTATEGMEDAAFEAVCSALAGSVVAEATSPLFTEAGVDSEAGASNVVAETNEMKILRAKYKDAA